MCVQCKYSHLVGEMLQPKNRLKRRMAFSLTSILCTGNHRTMRDMSRNRSTELSDLRKS